MEKMSEQTKCVDLCKSTLIEAIYEAGARAERMIAEASVNQSLSVAQYRLLRSVSFNDRLQPKALADILGISASAVSSTTESLVQRGLLLRTEQRDRRCQFIAITEVGRTVVMKIADELASLTANRVSIDESSELLKALSRINYTQEG